jgi:hypothetical protein
MRMIGVIVMTAKIAEMTRAAVDPGERWYMVDAYFREERRSSLPDGQNARLQTCAE